jgi:O-antigen/teichoic acid export membrane protein
VRAELRGEKTTVALYFLGTLAYHGGRLILNLVAAAIFGPVLFGTWVLLSLLVAYSGSLSLGIVNGANREIPYLSGAGRESAAERVEDVAFVASLGGMVGAVLLAILFGPLVIVADAAASPLWLLVGLLATALALQQLYQLQQMLFRSRVRFRAAAMQLLIVGIAIPLIGVPLLVFGLAGILVAQVAVVAMALGVGYRLLPRRPRLAWDGDLARRCVVIGFPIMVAGLVGALRTTIDRWLVLLFLSPVAVGHYGLVGVVMSGLLVLSGVISQQFYPRMAFRYGAGWSGSQLLALAERQNLYALGLLAVIAVPTGLAGWVLLSAVLTEYLPAAVPLLIVLVGIVVASASSGFGNLLITIGAQRRYLTIQAGGLLLNVALAVALLGAGLELVGVATASAVAMVLYSLALRWAARRAAGRLIPPPLVPAS